jgi:hypothetical protein
MLARLQTVSTLMVYKLKLFLMDQVNSLSSGLAATSIKRTPPTVGDKILLHLNNWSPSLQEVLEGSPMSPNGTYVEVEVRAIKTAKVVLE